MKTTKRLDWVRALQLGLIGGILALLVCLVGMVEEFSERDVIAGVISMGEVILLLIYFAVGYFTGARTAAKPGLWAVLGGATAGLVVGLLLAGLVLIIENFNIRQVFVHASPQLVMTLTFGLGVIPGIFVLIASATVAAAFGAAVYSLPLNYRRATMNALIWLTLIGLLSELIQVTLRPFDVVFDATKWMFGQGIQKGLSVAGAVFIFLATFCGNLLWSFQKQNVSRRVQAIPAGRRKPLRYLVWGLVAFFVLYLPFLLGLYLSEVINQVSLFILMGLGLNIVVGFAGLLDLGYVAFYALGAYTVGVLTTTGGELVWSFQWTFWQALPVAIFVATMAGIILGVPVLKMRGDYLAIVTLAFGEIIRILALSDWLKPYIGGAQGITEIPPAQIGPITISGPQQIYYLFLVAIIIALFIAIRLRDSRIGRSWKAMREDEDVAQAMGINLVLTKLLAFATGAAFSGLSGAILATKLGTIYPHSFLLLISINVLAVIIVGGMGSIPGVFVGSLILVGLPELLREFAEYRWWIYGALLVVMMQVRPEGFWPEATRKRELRIEEASETAEVNL
jgi:branched-chain amino acid transport system permease protein